MNQLLGNLQVQTEQEKFVYSKQKGISWESVLTLTETAYSECVRRKSRPHLLSRQTYGRYHHFEKVEIEDI